MWPVSEDDSGYLQILKKFLACAPRSFILASTRCKKFARRFPSHQEINVLEPRHSRAYDILGTAAFGERYKKVVHDNRLQKKFDKIVDICAGLPLALSIAGNSIREVFECSNDPKIAIETYQRHLEVDSLPNNDRETDVSYTYGLNHIVNASMLYCVRWQHEKRKDIDMKENFLHFSVFSSGTLIPKSVLSKLWNLTDRDTERVIEKYRDYSLLKYTKSFKSKREGRFVFLHDIVLTICKEMAKGREKEMHTKILDLYLASAGIFKLPVHHDDEYIAANISRHLVASERLKDLALILSDIRWAKYRLKTGDWEQLNLDFEALLLSKSKNEYLEFHMIRNAICGNWALLRNDSKQFLTYVVGYFPVCARKSKYVELFLNSLKEHIDKPFLISENDCFSPRDTREEAVRQLKSTVHKCPRKPLKYLKMSKTLNRVVSGGLDKTVRMWNPTSGNQVSKAVYRNIGSNQSVAIHNNLIVSGSSDGTIQRWNADTRTPLGNPLSGHYREVTSVAISHNGSIIVSGSKDNSIRSWSSKTGECIGPPLYGHKAPVSCIAFDSDGERIISGSFDCTLRRWQLKDGQPIGDPMSGHKDHVTCLAVSATGTVVVSGSADRTVRMWDAETGNPIAELEKGHESPIDYVELNSDGSTIISKSIDNKICIWDVRRENKSYRRSVQKPIDDNIWTTKTIDGTNCMNFLLPPESECIAVDVDFGIFTIALNTGQVCKFELIYDKPTLSRKTEHNRKRQSKDTHRKSVVKKEKLDRKSICKGIL